MDTKAKFDALREAHMPAVLALVDEVTASATPPGTTLAPMCAYHMETGGKRLRAILPLLVADALGTAPAALVPFGAACEMLHNATLVHDDLQDGDTVRRGRPTVWAHFGMPQAVNLGDAMFYYTLLLVQRLEVAPAVRERAARRVLLETLRVIDGQEREFSLKRLPAPTLDDYFAMVEGKTSGLFALPMAGAAELCGASDGLVAGLAEAARHMGVLFQIQDDVLDLFGDKGRDVKGTDIAEGKRSALAVHALATAPADESGWLRAVLDAPREETSPADIEAAIALLERVGSLDYALAEIERRRLAAAAVPALGGAPGLVAIVRGMCALFLAPIAPVVAARAERTR